MLIQAVGDLFRGGVSSNTAMHFEGIRNAQSRHKLHRVHFLSSPVFFDARERPRIAHILDQVTSAIEKVGELFFSGGTLPGGRPLHPYFLLSDSILKLCRMDSHRI